MAPKRRSTRTSQRASPSAFDILTLPPDVLEKILCSLPSAPDALRLAQTCSGWAAVRKECGDQTLYKALLVNRFPLWRSLVASWHSWPPTRIHNMRDVYHRHLYLLSADPTSMPRYSPSPNMTAYEVAFRGFEEIDRAQDAWYGADPKDSGVARESQRARSSTPRDVPVP